MKIANALPDGTRLLLDSAPIIYYFEKHGRYFPIVKAIFERLDKGSLSAVTTPVTLAECLVVPYRHKLVERQQKIHELILNAPNTHFVPISDEAAHKAAQLRGYYNLSLPDALQFGVALTIDCDLLLTNDLKLQRVTELPVVAIEHLEL